MSRAVGNDMSERNVRDHYYSILKSIEKDPSRAYRYDAELVEILLSGKQDNGLLYKRKRPPPTQ